MCNHVSQEGKGYNPPHPIEMVSLYAIATQSPREGLRLLGKIRTVCTQWRDVIDQRILPRVFSGVAEQNYSMMTLTGVLLAEGKWRDGKKAFALFSAASVNNYAPAICCLGISHETGLGTTRSLSTAFSLYTRSADLGYADAQYNLGEYYARKAARQVARRSAFESDLRKKPAFENNIDVDPPKQESARALRCWKKAARWYSKAARQNHVDAQYNLGICYSSGEGVRQSWRKAVGWFAKAAERGDADAQFNLGASCSRGRGIAKSSSAAANWFTLAAENGHADAQCCIGICHLLGRGVERSWGKAWEWLDKAAAQGHPEATNLLRYRTGTDGQN